MDGNTVSTDSTHGLLLHVACFLLVCEMLSQPKVKTSLGFTSVLKRLRLLSETAPLEYLCRVRCHSQTQFQKYVEICLHLVHKYLFSRNLPFGDNVKFVVYCTHVSVSLASSIARIHDGMY